MILLHFILFNYLFSGCFEFIRSDLSNRMDSGSRIIFSQESKMYLSGNTNVNTYTCDCTRLPDSLFIQFAFDGAKVVFDEFGIDISTSTIDCHSNLYNENIKKALDADNYPWIRLNLMEAWKADSICDVSDSKWFKVIAKTNIVIKETTKLEEVNAQAMRIAANKFRIKGKHLISMSDYNVKAPSFIFGLIHTSDQIEFNFDLLFDMQ